MEPTHMKNFTSGINLGGWLSQYKEFDHEHFQTFITEDDIRQIAGWGLDHVRLPVDYPVIESDDAVGVPVERGYAYIDACIQWCQNAGLAMVLDLHEAPGFTFRNDLEDDTKDKNVLFTDAATQDRFIGLWQEIVRRYQDAPVPIIFELLNEVTLPNNEPWNALIVRTVAAIREISPDAVIMIGGTHNNSVGGLKGLVEFDDPAIVYTFHTYDPLFFTHQNAYWSAGPREWGASPSYPGYLEGLGEFLDANPQHEGDNRKYVDWHMDKDMLTEILAPALEFAQRTGRELYCGEFGVADWIDPASRRAWLADFLGLLREHDIGFGLWSYKQMDFGVVDGDGAVVDSQYLDILIGR
jgi:hypothetical protein